MQILYALALVSDYRKRMQAFAAFADRRARQHAGDIANPHVGALQRSCAEFNEGDGQIGGAELLSSWIGRAKAGRPYVR
jgi:hypothetical protein